VCIRLKQWDQAAADLARVTQATPKDYHAWYGQAAAGLGAGDFDGYRKARRGIIANFREHTNHVMVGHVCYVSAALPATPEEVQALLSMAEFAASKSQQNRRLRGAMNFFGSSKPIAGQAAEHQQHGSVGSNRSKSRKSSRKPSASFRELADPAGIQARGVTLDEWAFRPPYDREAVKGACRAAGVGLIASAVEEGPRIGPIHRPLFSGEAGKVARCSLRGSSASTRG